MNKINTFTRLFLVIFFLSFLNGCPSPLLNIDTQNVRFKMQSIRSISDDKKSPREHYLGLLGKRNDAFGVLSGNWVLHEPLSVELQAGIFNPNRIERSIGAQGCLETDAEGTSLPNLVFNVICVQYTISGITIRAWDNNSSFNSPLGITDVGGVRGAYIGIDYDLGPQTNFTYSLDGLIWQTLATKASDLSVSGWTVGIGGSLIPKKGEIGLDNFTIPFHEPLVLPSTGELVRELSYNAMLSANNACNFIDGFDPDFTEGDLAIAESLMYSFQARQELEFYVGTEIKPKNINRMIKSLLKGDKYLTRASNKIKNEKVNPAFRNIKKGVNKYKSSIAIGLRYDF